MRISDWSSDVCSSDLWNVGQVEFQRPRLASEQYRNGGKAKLDSVGSNEPSHATARTKLTSAHSIWRSDACAPFRRDLAAHLGSGIHPRSEEHTSELQSLMRISYAVFCLKKNNKTKQ